MNEKSEKALEVGSGILLVIIAILLGSALLGIASALVWR